MALHLVDAAIEQGRAHGQPARVEIEPGLGVMSDIGLQRAIANIDTAIRSPKLASLQICAGTIETVRSAQPVARRMTSVVSIGMSHIGK